MKIKHLLPLALGLTFTAARADNFKRDFFGPDQGFFAKPFAAYARLSSDAESSNYYGGGITTGLGFCQSDYGVNSVSVSVAGLYGATDYDGSLVAGSTRYAYTASATSVAIPVIFNYAYTFETDGALRPFVQVGVGAAHVTQSFQDVTLNGVLQRASAKMNGIAPLASVGAGLRYRVNRSCELTAAYALTQVYAYDRSGTATVGNTKVDISDRTETATAHVVTVGVAFRF